MAVTQSNPKHSWVVRLGIAGSTYVVGYNANPKYGKVGLCAVNVASKQVPALRFHTETEAEIAEAAYTQQVENAWPTEVKQMAFEPTHRLTNEGFQPQLLAQAFDLFKDSNG